MTTATSQDKYARYRERHPERVKAACKKWRDANKPRVKELNDEFRSRPEYAEYHRNYNREWARNNPDRVRAIDWKRKRGITPEQYHAMYEAQAGNCAICGRHASEEARFLSVDHCHDTGVIRGLLCNRCNGGIGLLGDSADVLAKAITYLDRFQK
jgi:hypothetical protein